MTKRPAKRSLLISGVLAITFLATSIVVDIGCSRQPHLSKEYCAHEITYETTNTLKFKWPTSLTNVVDAAAYSYSTLTEGSQTTIYLEKLDADNFGISKLVETLRASQITVAGHRPVGNAMARKYADWWRPEDFGQCEIFELSAQNTATLTVLTGFITSGPANRPIFLQLRIMKR
jgi:hypothetical protein